MFSYASFVIFLLQSLVGYHSIFWQMKKHGMLFTLEPFGNSTDINERDLELLDIFWGEQATEKTRLEAYQKRT